MRWATSRPTLYLGRRVSPALMQVGHKRPITIHAPGRHPGDPRPTPPAHGELPSWTDIFPSPCRGRAGVARGCHPVGVFGPVSVPRGSRRGMRRGPARRYPRTRRPSARDGRGTAIPTRARRVRAGQDCRIGRPFTTQQHPTPMMARHHRRTCRSVLGPTPPPGLPRCAGSPSGATRLWPRSCRGRGASARLSSVRACGTARPAGSAVSAGTLLPAGPRHDILSGRCAALAHLRSRGGRC